ncbi:hypothetical protein RUND412_009488 [Rhizina undulata]
MENRPSGCSVSAASNALTDNNVKQLQLLQQQQHSSSSSSVEFPINMEDLNLHEALPTAPPDKQMCDTSAAGQAHGQQEDQPMEDVPNVTEVGSTTAVEDRVEIKAAVVAIAAQLSPASVKAISPTDVSQNMAAPAQPSEFVASVPEFPCTAPPIDPVHVIPKRILSTPPPQQARSAFFNGRFTTPPSRDLRDMIMAAHANISPHRNITVPSPIVEPGALHELGFGPRRRSSPNDGAIAGLEELRHRQASEGSIKAKMDPNVLDQLIKATKDDTDGNGNDRMIDAFLRLDFDDGNVYYLKNHSVVFGRAEYASSNTFRHAGPAGSTLIAPPNPYFGQFQPSVGDGEGKKKKKRRKLETKSTAASVASSTTVAAPGGNPNSYPLFRDPFAPPGDNLNSLLGDDYVPPEEHDPVIYLPPDALAKNPGAPPRKNISRRHARLAYNAAKERFEFSILGKNGAFVEEEFIQSGTVLVVEKPVLSVLIGGVGFRIVMPEVAGGGFDIDQQPVVERSAEKQPQIMERPLIRPRGGKGKAALAYYSHASVYHASSQDDDSDDENADDDEMEDVNDSNIESEEIDDEEEDEISPDDHAVEGDAESSSDDDSSDSSSDDEESKPVPILQPVSEEKKRGPGRPRKDEAELRRKEKEKQREQELIQKEKSEAIRKEKEKREREKKERERREREKREKERREKEREIERQRALEREREKEREREREKEKRRVEIQRIRDERAKQRAQEKETQKKKLYLPPPAKEDPKPEKKLFLPLPVVEQPIPEPLTVAAPVHVPAPEPEPEQSFAASEDDSASFPPTDHFESSVVPSLEPTPPPPMSLESEAIALAAKLNVSHLPAFQPPPPPPVVQNQPLMHTPIDPALYGNATYGYSYHHQQQQQPQPQQPEQQNAKRQRASNSPKSPKSPKSPRKPRAKKEKPPPKRKRTPSPEPNKADYPPEALLKPASSYVVLIHEAIMASPTRSLTLPQIYKAIERKYPYYKVMLQTNGWQSSVRHNLASHKAFVKIERNGKGWLWGIVEGVSIEKEKKGNKAQAMVMSYGPPQNAVQMQNAFGAIANTNATFMAMPQQQQGYGNGVQMQQMNNGTIHAQPQMMAQPVQGQVMHQIPHQQYHQQPIQQPMIPPPSYMPQPHAARANHKVFPPPPPPPNAQTNTAKAFGDAKARQALPRAPIPPANFLAATRTNVQPARPSNQAGVPGAQFNPETVAAIQTIQKLIAQAQANPDPQTNGVNTQSLAQASQMLAQVIAAGAASGAGGTEFLKNLVDNLKRQEARNATAAAAPIPAPVPIPARVPVLPMSSSATPPATSPPPISISSSPPVATPHPGQQAAQQVRKIANARQPKNVLTNIDPKKIKDLAPHQQQALLKALLAARNKVVAAPGNAAKPSASATPPPNQPVTMKAPIPPASAAPIPAPVAVRTQVVAVAAPVAQQRAQTQGGFSPEALVELLKKTQSAGTGRKRSIDEGEPEVIEAGPATKKVNVGAGGA